MVSVLLVISILFGMYSCSFMSHTTAPLQKVSIHVTDAITAEAVKGAKVTVGPSTMTTDNDGSAQFELSVSTYRYSVSANGYQQTGDKIEVSQNGVSKSVEIVPDAIRKAGTYGAESGSQKTISGNVDLAADGITLRNMKIKGNLTVDSTVGDGTVALQHLSVDGTATVKGGGSHSVQVEDCTFTSVIIDKSGVHVVMQGGTTAKVIDVKSQASLDASGVSSSNLPVAISASGEITLTGSFNAVEITDPNAVLHLVGGTVKNLEVAKGAENTQINLESGASVTNTEIQTSGAVRLSGSFENVQLSAAGTSLNLDGGTIQALSVTKDASSAKIGLDTGTNVTNLVLGSAATVTGGGHIRAASILASGSSIAQQPDSTALSSDVTATVSGVKVTGSSGASGNRAGNTTNGSGNGGTIDLSGLIQSQLAGVSISGSPRLTYNGSSFDYNLGNLTLSGKNRSGKSMDISWFPVTWTVISGPASVSGDSMTVSGSGSVTVRATVYGVASNELTLNVEKAAPVLWKLVVSGSPSLTYNGSGLTYDLSRLTLTGQDQFGNAYSLTGKTVTWGIVSGPAKIQGSIMTVTGSGTIVVQASAEGRASNQQTIPVTQGLPVLTNLKIFGNPALAYGGKAFDFDLNDLTLVGTDQFGNPYNIDKKQVEWILVSGPATLSGSVLTVAGSGAIVVAAKVDGVISESQTLTVAGAVPSLTNLILSGNPALNFNGTSFTYNLGELALNGRDQVGKAYDLTGKPVEWSVVSGPATVSGNTLTVTGSGTVVVSAKVGGITSNRLTLTVGEADQILTNVVLSGSPSLTYDGKDVPFDLGSLTLSGADQSGKAYDLTGRPVEWSVISGPAKISDGTLFIAGSGEVVIAAKVDGIASNSLTLKVGKSSGGGTTLSKLVLSGNPSLTYGGENLSYDLSGLTVVGYDQSGKECSMKDETVYWSVISGPAEIRGTMLNITGSGEIELMAVVDGIGSNLLDLTVSTKPEPTGIMISGIPTLAYDQTPITYDLSKLLLTGMDQYGNAFDFRNAAIVWYVVQGNATVSGSTLTITGSGYIDILATVDGISCSGNRFTLTVEQVSQPPVLTGITLACYSQLIYSGTTSTYELSCLSLEGKDQFGNYFNLTGLPVTWSVISGPAAISGDTLSLSGYGPIVLEATCSGLTSNRLTVTVEKGIPYLKSITLSCPSHLLYHGNMVDQNSFELNSLLSGLDQFGDPFDFSGTYITWRVLSGPADLSGNELVLRGTGTVVVQAVYDGLSTEIYSNQFSLTVDKAAPVLCSLVLSSSKGLGEADVSYGGVGSIYDLNQLILSGCDQFGDSFPINQAAVVWNLIAGPATLSGNMLTFTGKDCVTVTATVNGITTVQCRINPVAEAPRVEALSLSGNPVSNVFEGVKPFYYNGASVSYNLTQLGIYGLKATDQFGNSIDLSSGVNWKVISGPASVSGNILTITGDGTVEIAAMANGVTSNCIGLKVYGELPKLATLSLSGNSGFSYVAPISCDLNSFTLSGADQNGLHYDLGGRQISWAVVSGPASVSNNILTINGVGIISLAATVDGVTSNVFNITVTMGITAVYLVSQPEIIYDQQNLTLDLDALLLSAADTAGNETITDAQWYSWSVVSGPASISGTNLTVTGYGTIVLRANCGGTAAGTISLTVKKAASVLKKLKLSGGNIIYNGTNFTYDLGSLTLTGYDQFGDVFDLTGKQAVWGIVTGTDKLSGSVLAITSASIQDTVFATVGGISSDELEIFIERAKPEIRKLSWASQPTLTYNAADFNYDLKQVLSGTDQFGNSYDLSGASVTWTLLSGPASLNSGVLSITSSGTVKVSASVGDLSAGELDIAVNRAAPVLVSLSFSNCPVLTYNGSTGYYDLSKLGLVGKDQYGDTFDLTNQQINWQSTAASVSYIDSDKKQIVIFKAESIYISARVGYSMDAISTSETIRIVDAIPVLSCLGLQNYNPEKIRNGQYYAYNLDSIGLTGKDQFGNAYDLNGQTVTWTVLSGSATVRGDLLTPTGNGMITVQASVGNVASAEYSFEADGKIQSLSLSGNPELEYDGSSINFDLSKLTLTAIDEFGNPYSLTGQQLSWYAGNTCLSGSTLVITGSGTVSVCVWVNNICSNTLDLSVDRSASRMDRLSIDGGPQLTYAGKDLTYDLSSMRVCGYDQFGVPYNSNVTWQVLSGPATVSGSILTVTGSGTVIVRASSGNVVSNNLSFAVNREGCELAGMTLYGGRSFTYNGSNLTFDLNALTIAGVDQYGQAYGVNGTISWAVVSGPASVSGNTLTISGDGTVVVTATVEESGVTSSSLSLTVSRGAPYLSSLAIARNACPIPAYDGQAFNCKMNILTLSAKDQFGNAFSLDNLSASYSLVSGPATFDGTNLTIDSDGTIVLIATAGGVSSNKLSIAVSRNDPRLTGIEFADTPSLTYNGSPISFDLSGIALSGKDQFGTPFVIGQLPATYRVLAGPATVSGSTLTVTGSGTVQIMPTVNGVNGSIMLIDVGAAAPALSSLTVGGVPSMTYDGSSIGYDLKKLIILGTDQFGNSIGIDGLGETFSVLSGSATISGNMLTVNGSGTVTVAVSVGNVSKQFDITVNQAAQRLAALFVSGSPALCYNGANLAYDLGNLVVSGSDQFGGRFNLTGQTAAWQVLSGPASVQGSTLTVTGSGTVVIAASIGGVLSSGFSLTVSREAAALTSLTFNSTPSLSYNGAPLTLNLDSLGLTGTDQFGGIYNLAGAEQTFSVSAGKASVNGNLLTVTDSGSVTVTVTVSGISASVTLPVGRTAPELRGLTIENVPTLTYNGSSLAYDLGKLKVTGTDQFGAVIEFPAQAVVWTASGPATVSNGILTVTDSGSVFVSAEVNGVSSGDVKITVDSAEPVLSRVKLSGMPYITYSGVPVTFDLDQLVLQGSDQFGNPVAIDGTQSIIWSVVSGPASVSGSTLTVTGDKPVTMRATVGGVTSDDLALAINELAQPKVLSAQTSPDGTKIRLNFDQPMSMPQTGYYTVFIDGAAVSISGFHWTPGSSEIDLNFAACVVGKTITVSCANDAQQAQNGAYLAGFYKVTVADCRNSMQMAAAMHIAHITASEAVSTLNPLFSLDANTVPTLLKGAGYGAQETADAMITNYGWKPATIVSGFLSAGFSLSDIAMALRRSCVVDEADAWYALRAGGADSDDVTAAVSSVYTPDTDIIAGCLRSDGEGIVAAARQISYLYGTYYSGYSVPEDRFTASTLAKAGYSLNDAVFVLKNIYQDSADGVWSAIISPDAFQAYQFTERYAAFGDAYGLPELGNRLCKQSVSPQNVTGYMKALGFTGKLAGLAIKTNFPSLSADDFVYSLWNGKYSAAEAGSALANSFQITDPSEAYTALIKEYAEDDILDFLKSGLNASPLQIAQIMQGRNSHTSESIAQKIKAMYGLDAAGCLTALFNDGGPDSKQSLVGTVETVYGLKTAGDVMQAIQSLKLTPVQMAQLLFSMATDCDSFITGDNVWQSYRAAGNSAEDLARWCKSSLSYPNDMAAQVILSGGYSLTQTEKAVRQVYSTDIGSAIYMLWKYHLGSLSDIIAAAQTVYGVADAVPQMLAGISENSSYNESGLAGLLKQLGFDAVKSYGYLTHAGYTADHVMQALENVYGASANPAIASIRLVGNNNLLYSGTALSFDLGTLSILASDQYGNPISLAGKDLIWSVSSGPASVSGSCLTITGAGTVAVALSADGVMSNGLSLSVSLAQPELSMIILSGSPNLVYDGTAFTYDLGGLTVNGLDQYGVTYELGGTLLSWRVASGNASVNGGVLSLSDGGAVGLTVAANGVESNLLTLTPVRTTPRLTSLHLGTAPRLNNYGVDYTFDLNGLTLIGSDQFGGGYDTAGVSAVWSVVSGDASVSGHTLTVTGTSPITLNATVGNVSGQFVICQNTVARPNLVKAVTSADGMTIQLFFDQEMADPAAGVPYFSVLLNGNADPATGITRNPSDPTEIDLAVTNRVYGGSVTVSYRQGPVQAWSNASLIPFDAKNVGSALEKPAVALSLFHTNTPIAEAAVQLASLFGSNMQETVSLLKNAGYTADTVAQFLKTDGKQTDGQTAALMTAAGYFAADTAAELKQLYGDTDKVCAQNLLAGGAAPGSIAEALKASAYGDDDSAAAGVLLTVGVSAAETGSALKNVYHDTDLAAAQILLANSATADSVAAVMNSVYGDDDKAAAKALLQAGTEITAVAVALHEGLGASDFAAAYALKDLIPNAQMIAVLQAAPYQDGNAAVTAALKSAGLSIDEIAAAWQATLSDTNTVSLLKQTGYQIGEITQVLKGTFADSTLQAVAALTANQYQLNDILSAVKNQYGAADTEIFKALLNAGWAAKDIARIMMQAPYNLDIVNLPRTMYDAGVDATAALDILSCNYWKYCGNDYFFYLMVPAGYSLNDYAKAFKSIYGGEAYDVLSFFRKYTVKVFKPGDCIQAVAAAYGTGNAIDADMRYCMNDEGYMGDFVSNMVEIHLGIDDIISDINQYSHMQLSVLDYDTMLLNQGHFSTGVIGAALVKSSIFDAVSVGRELWWRMSDPEQTEFVRAGNITPNQLIQIKQSNGCVDTDVYETLVRIYGMKPGDACEKLNKGNFTAQQIGIILDNRGFGGAFVAQVLKQIGVDGITAIQVLQSWYSDSLKDYESAGFSAENLLEFMRSQNYGMNDALYLLHDAGYSASDAAMAAIGSYRLDMQNTIQALMDTRCWNASDINSAVSAIFANGGIDGARMQKLTAMKNSGESVSQTLNYVFGTYHIQDPQQIAVCLAKAGYGALDIAGALCDAFPLSMNDALDIAEMATDPGVSLYVSILLSQRLAGVSIKDVVSSLRYVYGVTDVNNLASYMLKAGYDLADVLLGVYYRGESIKDAAHIVAQAKGLNSDDGVIVLYIKKLGDVGKAILTMRSEFELTDLAQMVNCLLQAGYGEESLIHNFSGYTPGQVIQAIVQAENLSSPDSLYAILARKDKAAGYTDYSVADDLKNSGASDSREAAGAMIAAGFDLLDTAKAIQSAYGVSMGTAIQQASQAAKLASDDNGVCEYVASLYSSGLTAQQAVDIVYGQLTTDAKKAVSYLLKAGYQPFDILNPVIADFGVSAGAVLQNIADSKGLTSDDGLIASYLQNKKAAGATAQQLADTLKTDLNVSDPQKAMDFMIGNGCPTADAIESIRTSYAVGLGMACEYAAESLHIKDDADLLAGYVSLKRGAGVSAHDAADYVKNGLGVADASMGAKAMIKAGYGDIETAEEISAVYAVGLGDSLKMAAEAEGESSSDRLIAVLLHDKKTAGTGAADAVNYLKATLQVNSAQKAIGNLIAAGYDSIDSANAAADAYQIKELDAITLVGQAEGLSSLGPLFREYAEKCKAEGTFADDVAASLRTVLNITDPQTAADYLAEAGYQKADVANALFEKYSVMMEDANSMATLAENSSSGMGYAKSDRGAGFTAAQTAEDLKNNRSISDAGEAASLMISAGYSQMDTASAISACFSLDLVGAIQIVAQASGLSSVDSLYIGVVKSEKQSGADAQSAANVLKNSFGLSDPGKAVVFLVKGGYSAADAEAALSVYGVDVVSALGMLVSSGVESMDTLLGSYVKGLKESGAGAGSAAGTLSEMNIAGAQQAAAAMLSAGYSEIDVAKAICAGYHLPIHDAINDVSASEGKANSDSVNIQYLKENSGTITDLIRVIQNDLKVSDALTAMKYLFAMGMSASDIVSGISSAYQISVGSANSMAAQLQGLASTDSLTASYAVNLFRNGTSIDRAVLELEISCGVTNPANSAKFLIQAGYGADTMDMADALSVIYQISKADAINAIAGVCTDSTGKLSGLLEGYAYQLMSGGQNVKEAFDLLVSQGFSQQMVINALISAGASASGVTMGALESSSRTGTADELLSMVSQSSGQSIDNIVISCVYDCKAESQDLNQSSAYRRIVDLLKSFGFDDVKTAKYLLRTLGSEENMLNAFGACKGGEDMLAVDNSILQAVALAEGLASVDSLITLYMNQEWADHRTAADAAGDLYSKNIVTDPVQAAKYLLQTHYTDLQTANALVAVNYGHAVEYLNQAINLVAQAGGKFGLSRKSIYLDYYTMLMNQYSSDSLQVFKLLYATCQDISETASYFIDSGEEPRYVSSLINSYLALGVYSGYYNDGLTCPFLNGALKDSFNDNIASISQTLAGNQSPAEAAALLKNASYSLYDVASALKTMLGLSSDDAKAAMISAGYSDADALAAVRAVYNSDLFQLLHYDAVGLSTDHVRDCYDMLSEWCQQDLQFDVANFAFDMEQMGCSDRDIFTGILRYRGYQHYNTLTQQDVVNIERTIFKGNNVDLLYNLSLYQTYVYAVTYRFGTDSYFYYQTGDLESYIHLLLPRYRHVDAMKLIYSNAVVPDDFDVYMSRTMDEDTANALRPTGGFSFKADRAYSMLENYCGYNPEKVSDYLNSDTYSMDDIAKQLFEHENNYLNAMKWMKGKDVPIEDIVNDALLYGGEIYWDLMIDLHILGYDEDTSISTLAAIMPIEMWYGVLCKYDREVYGINYDSKILDDQLFKVADAGGYDIFDLVYSISWYDEGWFDNSHEVQFVNHLVSLYMDKNGKSANIDSCVISIMNYLGYTIDDAATYTAVDFGSSDYSVAEYVVADLPIIGGFIGQIPNWTDAVTWLIGGGYGVNESFAAIDRNPDWKFAIQVDASMLIDSFFSMPGKSAEEAVEATEEALFTTAKIVKAAVKIGSKMAAIATKLEIAGHKGKIHLNPKVKDS